MNTTYNLIKKCKKNQITTRQHRRISVMSQMVRMRWETGVANVHIHHYLTKSLMSPGDARLF